MSKVNFIESLKFAAFLVKLNKDANSLYADVQLGMVSCVMYAVKDGNVSTLNGMMTAVGKGMRKPAMAAWILKFAPVVLNDNKEQAKEMPFKFSKDKLAAILEAYEGEREEIAVAHAEEANLTMWTDYKEPPLVPETWSLQEAIKKLVTQAKGYQAKGTKVQGDVHIRALESLLANDVQGV